MAKLLGAHFLLESLIKPSGSMESRFQRFKKNYNKNYYVIVMVGSYTIGTDLQFDLLHLVKRVAIIPLTVICYYFQCCLIAMIPLLYLQLFFYFIYNLIKNCANVNNSFAYIFFCVDKILTRTVILDLTFT